MSTLRKARALRPGDTIGIATPASPIEEAVLEEGETLVRALGFEPRRGSSVTARHGYLAGDDERRADELTSLVTDPNVHGILCARGGYGCHRIIARLDASLFRKAAKPLVGYSDITTLLLWQRRAAGLMGVHGPMLETGEGMPGDDHRDLARALTGVGEPLIGRVISSDSREYALSATIRGEDRLRASVAIPTEFLAAPDRYIVEIKTTEQSHFPIRRYVILVE